MKWFIVGCLFFLIIVPVSVFSAGPRYAECDVCGYCLDKPAPDDWLSCKECLYPGASDDPYLNDTLVIDTQFNRPIMQPAQGKYYTQLGCIDTSLSTFTDPSASGGVLNFLLKVIFFPMLGAVGLGYFIYGVYVVATSRGNIESKVHGKNIMLGSLIGVVFTIFSVFILGFIQNRILRIPAFSVANSNLTLFVASQCAPDKPNGCPVMVVEVEDTVNNQVILYKEETVITSNLVNQKPDSSSYFINFGPYNLPSNIVNLDDIELRIGMEEDYATGGVDRNLYLRKATIGQYICKTWDYYHHDPPEYPILGIFWDIEDNGYAVCTSWGLP